MLERSEIRPMIAGHTAPPMIDIHRREEPRLVLRPRFLMLKAKMVGNMIEWKNPINTMASAAGVPEAVTATTAQINEPPANNANRCGGETRFMIPEPKNLPIMKTKM